MHGNGGCWMLRGSKFNVRCSEFRINSAPNHECGTVLRVVIVVIEIKNRGEGTHTGQREDYQGPSDGFAEPEPLFVQPGENESQIARRQQPDEVRRTDMQRPGPVFAVEMDVE